MRERTHARERVGTRANARVRARANARARAKGARSKESGSIPSIQPDQRLRLHGWHLLGAVLRVSAGLTRLVGMSQRQLTLAPMNLLRFVPRALCAASGPVCRTDRSWDPEGWSYTHDEDRHLQLLAQCWVCRQQPLK